MKTLKSLFTIIFLITFLAVPSFAEEYEIAPKYYDVTPNDGLMDAGSYSNPYVIKDDTGEKIGEIKSRYLDLDTDDGFMDAGSFSNPYIYEIDDRD